MASSSADVRAERDVLHRDAVRHLHHYLSERAVLLRLSDPRWEAMLEPDRAEQIVKAGLEDLYGYRPVFIGIVGGGVESTDAFPWLRDIAGDPGIAVQFMARVVASRMMRDRAFFYVLGSDTSGGPPPDGATPEERTHDAATPDDNSVRRIIERARREEYVVRDGITDLEDLARRVRDDLETAFERMNARGGGLSIAERDRRAQAQFADGHRRGYVEVGSYLDHLHEQVLRHGRSVAVLGDAGAGKSALLVNWVDLVRTSHPDVAVISRYVDAAVGDDDPVAMLRALMLDVREYCGVPGALPHDTAALVEQFPQWLAYAPADRTVVVVVDDADRLGVGMTGRSWLPRSLPGNVRLVVSGTRLEIPSTRMWTELRVEVPTLAQVRSITDRLVAESGNPAASELIHRIVDTSALPSPFFIRTIAHHAGARGASPAADVFRDVGTVEALMDRLLQQGEARCGAPLTGRVLALLRCARTGLRGEELQGLTSADEVALAGVLAEFEAYLADRDGLLALTHYHMRRAVERRYLADREAVLWLHSDLGAFFADARLDEHRVDEEAWHWLRAEDRERLADCITAVPMFMALSAEDRRYELLGHCVVLDDADALIDRFERGLTEWRATTTDAAAVVDVLERLGQFCTTAGWLVPAERFLRAALASKQELFGAMHSGVAETLHDLGELLRLMGAFAEAEEAYLGVLAIRRKQGTPKDPVLAGALSDLALLYSNWSRPDQALPLSLEAVALKEQIHGENHHETAESLNDLALLYHGRGELQAAAALNKRALAIRQAWFGFSHPVVATSHNNLGSVCRDMKDPAAAEQEYRMALIISEDRLGADHPHTIGIVANLASLLHARGALAEARLLFRRAIDTTTQTLGADHPNATAYSINYAKVLRDGGDLAGAEHIVREQLHRLIDSVGGHPYLAVCANNLGVILRLQKRNAEALPFFAMAVAAWESSVGPDHQNIASALRSMAAAYFVLGDPATAEPLARRAVTIRTQHFGADAEQTRNAVELLAKIMRALA